jgi:two-component system, chemotaxis family, protein-glutamate methylesterase/glutaminase
MSLGSKTSSRTRVLIVDDSAFMRTALSRMISSEARLEVVGTACNGTEALDRIPSLNPDVITLDVEMPGLNGLETLRRIMQKFPRPVIMVSSATEKDAETTFNALGIGAFDYIPKQLSRESLDIFHIQPELIAKIDAAAHSTRSYSQESLARKPPRSVVSEDTHFAAASIVAIGTSTGGPKALQEILPVLPRDLGVPVLVVQHMPLGFTSTFAQRLNSLCAVTVREAAHREPIENGVVYIAPAGMHMTVERKSESETLVCLSKQPGKHIHIPSVDVMMMSVAQAFGLSTMGIIMTGMGSDGVEGMKAIHRRGGFTLGQDESTCTVYGMPRVCAELGILSRVATLSQIPRHILNATRYRRLA